MSERTGSGRSGAEPPARDGRRHPAGGRVGVLAKLLVAVLVTAVVVTLSLTPLLGNVYSLVANAGFFIPCESSVLTFRVLVENPGSGEWWLRGEDGRNFYAIDDDERIYYVFPKRELAACPAFSPMDLATWCPSITLRAGYE